MLELLGPAPTTKSSPETANNFSSTAAMQLTSAAPSHYHLAKAEGVPALLCRRASELHQQPFDTKLLSKRQP